jgi:hypothetical protein
MKHSKASSRKDVDSISSALATHKSKASIKKNASQRKVHAALAEAFKKTIKTNSKLKDEWVTMPLSTLSEATLHWEEELDESVKKNKVYERILWEGRYCDYIAKILKKVKSSRAWQASEFNNWMWKEVQDTCVIPDPKSDLLEAAILNTASELGVPSQSIKIWIYLDAARCGTKALQGGIANHIARHDTLGVVKQLIDDKKSIYDLTPKSLEGSISSVLLAIEKYQKELFVKCELKDYRVTKQGKKLGLRSN